MRADDPRPPRALEQRFRWVHTSTYDALVRFVERRVPHADAEDVVSTTFLTAWRRVADMPDDARPWMFGIARNLIRNSSSSPFDGSTGTATSASTTTSTTSHLQSSRRRSTPNRSHHALVEIQ